MLQYTTRDSHLRKDLKYFWNCSSLVVIARLERVLHCDSYLMADLLQVESICPKSLAFFLKLTHMQVWSLPMHVTWVC